MTKRKTKRAPPVPEKDAYTIDEFCARHGLSRATFYNLRLAHKGPRVMRVSKRMFISKEAARDWRAAQENGNGAPVTDAPQNPATPPA